MSTRRTSPVYTAQVPQWVARHEAFTASRQRDPGWLVALRAESMARFAELGFPSPSLEEWRYTNVAEIAKLEPGWTPEDPASELPERIGSVLDAKDRAFALLNTAFLCNVDWLRVPRGESLDQVVTLDAAAGVRHPRVFLELEEGSRATIVIDCAPGAGSAGLTNLVLEADVGANASLDLVVLQGEHDEHFHVSNVACRVARDGRLATTTLTTGGALVRNDLEVALAGEGAECELRGLFIGAGARLVDNHTSVDHAMPHTTSRELYKGILGQQARGVFRGRVVVWPDAQKTDATQSNRNLLLGERAEIDTKPQLEIYADDVKCAHGATVGQLDEDALFYLRSRALGLDAARSMLIHAFAREITDALPAAAGDAARETTDRALEEAAR